jgi:hypothetical protein
MNMIPGQTKNKNKAQKRAQARYDKKRPKGILVRLTDDQIKILDEQGVTGESRPTIIKRLLGFKT